MIDFAIAFEQFLLGIVCFAVGYLFATRQKNSQEIKWVECKKCEFRAPLWVDATESNVLKKHRDVCPCS